MAPAKQPLTREERRRMAAARGYSSLSHTDLGQRLEVSRDTVQRAESGETKFQPHEREAWLRRVAEVAGLPIEFFTVDFARLPELRDEPRVLLSERVAAAQRRRDEGGGLTPERIREFLDRLEAVERKTGVTPAGGAAPAEEALDRLAEEVAEQDAPHIAPGSDEVQRKREAG